MTTTTAVRGEKWRRPLYGRGYGNKVRPRWWSLVNWLKGYKFGPIRRHRCCDHTTPSHYAWCARHGTEAR